MILSDLVVIVYTKEGYKKMGRDATKATGNVWYEARMEAAKWNEKLSSRSGAAEYMNVSEDVIKDSELGLYKVMPVEHAVRMADAYNAPYLLNHYCLNYCPIGCTKPLSDQKLSVDRITVKLMKALKIEDVDKMKGMLINIAADGEVTEDEIIDLYEVLEYTRELQKTLSELEIIGKAVLENGKHERPKRDS